MRPAQIRKCVGGVSVALAVTVLAACGASSSSNSNTTTGGTASTVSMSLVGPVTSLDPVKGSSFQDYVADFAIYDPLVVLSADGQVIPALAKSWTVTPSKGTFTLQPGVTCSDGTKLTAAMAAASLKRFMDPKTAAPWLSQVIGAGNTATVTGDDTANSVTIALAKPYAGMLSGLTSPFTGIVCPSGLANPAGLGTTSAGTGPYTSVSQIAGSSYTFKRRADYNWGPAFANAPTGNPPSTLVMKVVPNESTAANLVSTKQLQIAGFSGNDWTRFKGQSGFSNVVQPQSDTFLVFNETAGHPTANKATRLAIAQAIDRNALNKAQSYGEGSIISNLGESNYSCFDSSLGSLIPSYDKGAAAKTLSGLNIRVIGTTVVSGGAGTTYVQAALANAGAKTTLNNMNNEAWVGDLFGGKNDWDVTILVLGNTVSTFFESGGFFVGQPAPKGSNVGAINSPSNLALFDKAATQSGAAQCTTFSALQRSLFTNVDVLPLATAPVVNVFSGGTSAVIQKGFVMAGTIRVS